MTQMHRWERIGRQLGGGWMAGERAEAQADWQQRLDRNRHMSGTGTLSATSVLRDAGKKAARIFDDWRSATQTINNDPMIPVAGKQHKTAELKNKAVEDLAELEKAVDAAEHVAAHQLRRKRDDARPKVSEATRARIEGYYQRLADSGVSLERLIDLADGDSAALRCLEDLAPILAMSARPEDPNAGDGFVDLVHSHALNAYGESYTKAVEAELVAKDAAYYAHVGLAQVKDGLKDPESLPVVPNHDGSGLVYNAASAA
jgi:type I site-specific restriction endonuclease